MFKDSYVWLLVAAVLLLSIQIIAVVIYAYSFVPLVWDDSFLKGLEPTRDPLFYVLFLGLNVVLMALAVKLVLPRLNSPGTYRKFKVWLGLESVWCFLVLFCFFKWSTYRYPFWNILPYENQAWLRPFFYVVCGLAALSKVFFLEIEKFYGRLKINPIALQAAFIGGVVLLLYIPRPEDVAALALAWDQWDHLDRVAGWFIKHGWYVSYEQVIQMLVIAAVAYITALFYFIRLWLGSWLLAAAGALLAIKLGMFYYGASPCIWINPGNTFLAHGWDILLLFGLWRISIKRPEKFYTAAAVAGAALIAAWIISGGYIAASGLDNQPMMAPLRVRQFFPFFMGYLVPVFYVFSLLAARERFMTVLCMYGLMVFVDYIEHPMTGFYGSLMVPAILAMLWWLKQLSRSLALPVRRGVYAGIFALAAGALLTNRLMLVYPNVFFQDQKRFEKERALYEHFDAVTASAPLIRRLVPEDQKVVLLSNFETALLMQAHRSSLFKDFPVMFSGLSNGPGGLNLKTKEQCLGLINSMASENALYVFVDMRLWALPPQAPANAGLNAVLGYLRDHYQEYARQGFLVALRRKEQ